MAPHRKRPISVWIAQILFGLYGGGGVLIVLWGLYQGLSEGIKSPELFFFTTVGILAFVSLFCAGFWGMAIRKPWGRWLGVAGVVVLLIATAVNLTSRWHDSGAPYILFTVLAAIGLAFLAYKLAAGDAAEEFFKGRPTNVSEHVAVAESDKY